MSDVEPVSSALCWATLAARGWWSTTSAIIRRPALVAALAAALTSCAAPYAVGNAAAPTIIAVYVPPIGPHGRGSVLLLPYSSPLHPKQIKLKTTRGAEAPASDGEGPP